MSTAIEDTVKALIEFESELDRAKSEASDLNKKMVKDSGDWAASAKSVAVSRAQQLASERMAKARADAGMEADSIREKAEKSLKAFESSISKHKRKAAEMVVARLLGESA